MKCVGMIAALMLVCGVARAAETLSVAPYPATTPWKMITDKHDDPRFIWIEFIPADQTEADIHDILTEQTFYTQKGRDPSDFVRTLFGQSRSACRAVRANGPTPQTENGFAVAYGQVYCVGASGKDVDIFIKAIAGHDALYVVQREFRRPADPAAMPGMRQFPKGEKDAAIAMMQAQGVANHYLVAQVKLCADGPTCGTADAAPAESTPSPAQPSATASASASQPAKVDDLSPSFGFEAGKTTQDQVEEKLGHPTMQNRAADGRHVDVYNLKGGSLIATFLFDKNNVLIRTAAYSHQ